MKETCRLAGTLNFGKWLNYHEQSRRVYSPYGVSPTVHTQGGGGQELKIEIARFVDGGSYNYKLRGGTEMVRIRKLTERECFRLMGVKDEDFDKVNNGQASSSLYHLAGDSIVTTCLMGIFGELLGIDYESKIDELMSVFPASAKHEEPKDDDKLEGQITMESLL